MRQKSFRTCCVFVVIAAWLIPSYSPAVIVEASGSRNTAEAVEAFLDMGRGPFLHWSIDVRYGAVWQKATDGESLFPRAKDNSTGCAILIDQSERPMGERREHGPEASPQEAAEPRADEIWLSVMQAQRLYNDKRWVNPMMAKVTNAKDERPTEGRAQASDGWIDVICPSGPEGLHRLAKEITHCGDVRLSDKAGELIPSAGTGVVTATYKIAGSADANLISTESFGDCEVYLEFLLGTNSNSGIKLQQRYEIQLFDSHGRDQPSGRDCGGIYPHWVFRPDGKGLKYLDEGVPPMVNAAKLPGEWQTLSIVFRAPSFDTDGNKVRNARFESVVLNGQIVHQQVELDSPTGNASTPLKETSQAPLLLQMDHGAVAFRNVRVRRL